MAIINLRDYYPFYTSDCFMEVSDEVAEMFKEFDRKEAAYRLRTYRHKAYYSLDRDDGLEHEAIFVALSPHELYERKVTMQELHAAIASLPDKQAKRIYAHFILGMTKQDMGAPQHIPAHINPGLMFLGNAVIQEQRKIQKRADGGKARLIGKTAVVGRQLHINIRLTAPCGGQIGQRSFHWFNLHFFLICGKQDFAQPLRPFPREGERLWRIYIPVACPGKSITGRNPSRVPLAPPAAALPLTDFPGYATE